MCLMECPREIWKGRSASHPLALGGKVRECVFNGDRAALWDDEKVLEMDGGDGSTTGWMHLTSLKNAT